ncbi:ATP-binding protein [Candidatus Woesearchaeota archaeon]|nr:ATP-binding protein [Candidatus Woesearchaeota archaeon]
MDIKEYDSIQFVGRQAELDTIDAKVRKIQSSEKPLAPFVPLSPFVIVEGSPGIGKTWFLSELEHRYNYTGEETIEGKPTFSVMIDLEQYSDSLRGAVTPLLRDIADQINAQIGSDYKVEFGSRDQMAQGLCDWIIGLQEQYTPVIIFDNGDEVQHKTFAFLEQHILSPLVQTDKIVFVLENHGYHRLTDFQVRRRVDEIQLGALNPEESSEQFNRLGFHNKKWADYFHQTTGGHPLANRQIFDTLSREGLLDEGGETFFDELYNIVLEKIDSALSVVVNEELLKDIDPKIRPLCEAASTLRRFSPDKLQYFSQQRELGILREQRGDAYFQDRIGDMLRAGLVDWDVDSKFYAMDPAARAIIGEALLRTNSERYQELHRAAVELYDEEIQRHGSGIPRFVPERAYHRACQLTANPGLGGRLEHRLISGSGEDTLLPEFNASLIGLSSRSDAKQILTELYDKLKEDRELERTVTAPVYQIMLNYVQKKIN